MKVNRPLKAILIIAFFFCLPGCAENDTSSGPATVTAKVIDKIGPNITTIDKTIEEGETVKLSDLYTVDDVVTKEPEVTVTCDDSNVTIKDDTASFKTTGEFNFKVVSTDEEGNRSESPFKVTVNVKPEPTPEPTPTPTSEATAEAKKETSTASASQSSSQQQAGAESSSQQTREVQQAESATQQSTQPVTKYFMFSDGYTMTSALPACKAEFSNYGDGTKKCDPIVGDDGLYKGYVFTYNP